MILQIKKLHPDAVIPHPKHDTDAGMDLYALESGVILPGERMLVHTGIAIALPIRTEAQIRPRSGLALKHGVTVLNAPGTVDEDYRGEVGVILINHGREDFLFEKGDRIAQMVIKPTMVGGIETVEVEELDVTERNTGGYGSTGR